MKYYLFLMLFVLIGCQSTPSTITNNQKVKDVPKITKPIVKKVWIPQEIKNNGTELVEGHYMFVIEKESSWSQ